MTRELVVLGTAAQVPTRARNHNGYLLRWDEDGFLFDPGEGTQRQMLLAGVSASSVSRICVTHTHGDHCLGLAGVVQRMGLDGLERPVGLHYPAQGSEHVDALLSAASYVSVPPLHRDPVDEDGVVATGRSWTLSAALLDHRIAAVGYRLQEPDGVTMLPERLEEHGIRGPDVGRLVRDGSLTVSGRRVRVDEVSEPRPGQSFAFVMDTRWCQAALTLSRDVDMLVCESTFLDRDRELAERYGHLTARQAGLLAERAGARTLVLTHFSQRYGEDGAPFLAEASEVFTDVVAADDLQRVPMPRRRRRRRDESPR
jgi:ribonuclease Z